MTVPKAELTAKLEYIYKLNEQVAETTFDLNKLADVPWGYREKIRTIEGYADKIDEKIFEVLETLDPDLAEQLAGT